MLFDGFERAVDPGTARRLGVAAASSLVLCGAILAAALLLTANTAPARPRAPKVDVVFRPPPPPPPPLPVEAPPPLPRPAKISPRPQVAKATAAAAPAAAALEAPAKAPEAAPVDPAQVAEVEARSLAVGGTGDGSGAATGGGGKAGPAEAVASAAAAGPVQLPEDAEPPEELEGNARPDYPEAARSSGREGLVVLKIVVESDGRVGKIAVLKGDEPFVAVAVAAVQRWKYAPARFEGEAIAVYRVVKIPFRLTS